MSKKSLIAALRTIPDFPVKGIIFMDITSLLQRPDTFKEIVDSTVKMYKDKGITKVVGIESRGFIVGAAVAYKLGAGFIPARKPGKLPYKTISQEYEKEYGTDTIEIHEDAIGPDDVVLVHDDLIATGGSAAAAINLVKKFSPKKIYANFIIELTDLPGRANLPADVEVDSLLAMKEK